MTFSTAALFTLVLTMPSPDSNNPLEPFEWENRLILYLPGEDDDGSLEAILEENSREIETRDLVFLRLHGKTDLPHHEPVSEESIPPLRERFELPKNTRGPIFILIGKDGTEKDRQKGSLDLEAWFERIDSMPMRQREMARERGNP